MAGPFPATGLPANRWSQSKRDRKDGKDEIFLEDGDQILFPERAKVEVK